MDGFAWTCLWVYPTIQLVQQERTPEHTNSILRYFSLRQHISPNSKCSSHSRSKLLSLSKLGKRRTNTQSLVDEQDCPLLSAKGREASWKQDSLGLSRTKNSSSGLCRRPISSPLHTIFKPLVHVFNKVSLQPLSDH